MSDFDPPPVDIVTVSYNSSAFLPEYFRALKNLDYPAPKVRLILVDNASGDDSANLLKQLRQSLSFASDVIFPGRNLGFAGGCNEGAGRGTAPFILFLNPDAACDPQMLRRLVERAASEPEAGLIDAAQDPVELPKWRDPARNYTDWCSGAAVLARREAFDSVGGFDAFFYPAYCEDVDLSWRMWLAGWRCVYEPEAKVTHYRGPKPLEMRLSVRYSFAMRFIYGTRKGLLRHLVRGVRYLCSPRTESLTRRAVAEGLLTIAVSLPHLLSRRRATQSALRHSSERPRFVFTEWSYGRWIER
jgi:GT2 family glycosyltransferase